MNWVRLPLVSHFVGQVLEGVAKPTGEARLSEKPVGGPRAKLVGGDRPQTRGDPWRRRYTISILT